MGTNLIGPKHGSDLACYSHNIKSNLQGNHKKPLKRISLGCLHSSLNP